VERGGSGVGGELSRLHGLPGCHPRPAAATTFVRCPRDPPTSVACFAASACAHSLRPSSTLCRAAAALTTHALATTLPDPLVAAVNSLSMPWTSPPSERRGGEATRPPRLPPAPCHSCAAIHRRRPRSPADCRRRRGARRREVERSKPPCLRGRHPHLAACALTTHVTHNHDQPPDPFSRAPAATSAGSSQGGNASAPTSLGSDLEEGGCSEGEGSPHSSSARFRTWPTHRTTSPATSSRATSWLAARAAPGRRETWRETPPLASLLSVQLSGSSLRRRRGGEVGRRGVVALGFGALPESPLSERFDTTF
jgi:hypothetical protein